MIIIKSNGKNIESILKKYRLKTDRIGQLTELKDRREFIKPSAKQRKIKLRAQHKSRNKNVNI